MKYYYPLSLRENLSVVADGVVCRDLHGVWLFDTNSGLTSQGLCLDVYSLVFVEVYMALTPRMK